MSTEHDMRTEWCALIGIDYDPAGPVRSFLWQRAGRSEGNGNDVFIKEAHTGQMWPEIQASCARTAVQWPRYRLVHLTAAVWLWYRLFFVEHTQARRGSVLCPSEGSVLTRSKWQFGSYNLLCWFYSCWFFCLNFQCCSVPCWLATEPKAFKVPQHHSSRAGRCDQEIIICICGPHAIKSYYCMQNSNCVQVCTCICVHTSL